MITTNGGTYIANDAQIGHDLIGRDQFNNTVSIQIPHGDCYLHQIWHCLDADLQDALTLAYNQAKREGENSIMVEHLFAALARLHPKGIHQSLSVFLSSKCSDSANHKVIDNTSVCAREPELAPALKDSLTRLISEGSIIQKVTSFELLIDIFTHATDEVGQRYNKNLLCW